MRAQSARKISCIYHGNKSLHKIRSAPVLKSSAAAKKGEKKKATAVERQANKSGSAWYIPCSRNSIKKLP